MFLFGKVDRQADQARQGGSVSVIGTDVVVSGDVATADELRIDGRIEGNVRCGRLDQGEDGVICGDVVAEEARIAGIVEGRIDVRTLTLEPSARVTGDVSYECLAIAAGARIEGRLAHRDGPSAGQPSGNAARGEKTSATGGAVAELFPLAAE